MEYSEWAVLFVDTHRRFPTQEESYLAGLDSTISKLRREKGHTPTREDIYNCTHEFGQRMDMLKQKQAELERLENKFNQMSLPKVHDIFQIMMNIHPHLNNELAWKMSLRIKDVLKERIRTQVGIHADKISDPDK